MGDVSALNQTRKDHAEGRRQFREIREYLTEALTDPKCPIDNDMMRTIMATGMYFDDLAKPINQVVRIYDERKRRELRDAILLNAVIRCLNILITYPQTEPAKPAAASKQAIKVRSIVPKS